VEGFISDGSNDDGDYDEDVGNDDDDDDNEVGVLLGILFCPTK
jgi:hypothetical protein